MIQKRLLEIAVREFGEKGLDGASTRSIAQAAGTAMSSITYHYGGKDGLYLAAADYVASEMARGSMPDSFFDDRDVLTDPEASRAMIVEIMMSLLDRVLAGTNAGLSLFLLREQLNPTEAFSRLYNGMLGRLLERLAELLAAATGYPLGDAVKVAAISLVSQCFALRSSRAGILRLLGRDTIDEEIAALLRTRIAENTEAIIAQMKLKQQEPA